MTLRSAIKLLLGLALALPLIQSLLVWVAGLLAAMGDDAAAEFLTRTNTAIGVLWLASLVGLLVVLAAKALDEPPQPPR